MTAEQRATHDSSVEDLVRERYAAWLAQQDQAGVTFTEAEKVVARQHGLGDRIICRHGRQRPRRRPFTERGGVDEALRDLGDRAADLIVEMNTRLTA